MTSYKVFSWSEFRDTPRKAWVVVYERMACLVGDKKGVSRYILNHTEAFLSPWLWSKG